MAKAQQSASTERREFFRINYKTPVEYKRYPESQKTYQGVTQNISQSGVLFQTEKEPPKVSSILWMNLDIRTLKICQEIENRAIIFKSGLLGRVVRVEEVPQSNIYDVGVCFLTQDQKNSAQVQKILSEFSTR